MMAYLLIGGIGAGKSSVAALFVSRGAAYIDLDAIGHEVLKGAKAQSLLLEAFGPQILCKEEGGELRGEPATIDRAALAACAFANESATKRLNAIMHPLIEDAALEQLSQLEEAGISLVLVEASAYNGPDSTAARLQKACQGVIAVCAPEDIRVARACARGLCEQEVRARLANQPSDAQRLAWADFVISNAGDRAALETQVEALMLVLVQKRFGNTVEGDR